MDWREELDDKANLSTWNFFYLERFKDFLEHIEFERKPGKSSPNPLAS